MAAEGDQRSKQGWANSVLWERNCSGRDGMQGRHCHPGLAAVFSPVPMAPFKVRPDDAFEREIRVDLQARVSGVQHILHSTYQHSIEEQPSASESGEAGGQPEAAWLRCCVASSQV